MVEVGVDVDGKYFVLRCPADCFNCEFTPEKRIMCEGIEEDGKKSIHFREIVPLKLNEEEVEILRQFISSFKPI